MQNIVLQDICCCPTKWAERHGKIRCITSLKDDIFPRGNIGGVNMFIESEEQITEMELLTQETINGTGKNHPGTDYR